LVAVTIAVTILVVIIIATMIANLREARARDANNKACSNKPAS
jgi:hypothetical protein